MHTVFNGAVMARVSKRIYYFRSVGVDGQPVDFSQEVAALTDGFPTISQSEMTFVDDVVRVQRFKDSPNGRLYHLAKYSPGTKNSTLTPKAKTKTDRETGHSAPPGKEFKSGECFLLINGYHILFCSHGINQAKAGYYFQKLISSAGQDVEEFKLKPTSNLDKLKILNEQGVRSVRLDVSAYKLSLPNRKRNWLTKAITPVVNELSALVAKDATRSEEQALEDLIVTVEVGLEGNSRASDDSKSTVIDLAAEFIDENEFDVDAFTIITRENISITGHDIRLHTAVTVEKTDNSVNHVDIWDALQVYYAQLKKQKLLEK